MRLHLVGKPNWLAPGLTALVIEDLASPGTLTATRFLSHTERTESCAVRH